MLTTPVFKFPDTKKLNWVNTLLRRNLFVTITKDLFLKEFFFTHNFLSQGAEFESVVQQLVEALCKLGEAESVQGVYTWCRDVVGRKFTWIKAAVEKAYGR